MLEGTMCSLAGYLLCSWGTVVQPLRLPWEPVGSGGAQQDAGFSCLCSPVGRAVCLQLQRSPAALVPGAAPAALCSVAVLRGAGVWCFWGVVAGRTLH